jgi:transposase
MTGHDQLFKDLFREFFPELLLEFPRFCGHLTKARRCAGRWPMARRKRRQFSPDFKAEAVRLVEAGDRPLSVVARDLDLDPKSLRQWKEERHAAASPSPTGPLTSAEREELVRLRRENRRLQMERDILKKAAAFFARENE